MRAPSAWAAGLVAALATAPAASGELLVRLSGVEVADGEVRIALYADEAAFERRTSFRATTLTAVVPGLEVRFADVPAGDYAVLVHHDVDGDGILDRGRFDIPSEPWTGSTSGTRFRAPRWVAYAFAVPAGGLSISMSF